ncbi:FtsX-like permease family protein [Mucilaginibacter rubeus]|uniref:ABC transporter permease n=1 Tax=Mucilaginibacter rubeus TaxID=2027860 RepID=A0AAE6JM55_9SPHI|nr:MULTISPECIES: ABC transporter permease [Mucilaginibacter]QEM08048.1 FtsX-like permease family protein [Mucilaginibacter rubeus]QEM20500.1 FtsX-like permease family protein [Mucilaginibacter gossypii]QTE42775.1 ABC transporter permease [Mucilaginibacter rubeus]QTE49376.1 ABC transporter permease [Mucilaginibacter rubeus]QTE54472.1 ABC transporter permease [Mucilaginibacter rubeus]
MTAYSFHITLYDLAFLAAIFIGLTFSLLLWFTRSINRSANRFLALAMLTIVLWMARVLGESIGLGTYFPDWSRLPLQFSLALGPLLYFYVLKITRPGYKLHGTDLLHFIPLLLQQGIFVLEIGQSISTDVATFHTPVFQQTGLALNMAAFISVVAYLYISFRLIESYYQQLKFNHINDRYRTQMRWLVRLIKAFGFLWLLWLPYAVADFFYFHWLGTHVYYPLYLLLAGMMIWIAAIVHSKPGALVTEQAYPVLKAPVSADLRQKGTWLRKAMEANLYHQDAELNLTSLAEKLGFTVHELSRIINVALKKNFNDFINEYRVTEVIRRMRDPAFGHITLLGIALESGFNSKSSFNRIFKQMTGKSPAEYKNAAQKEFPSYNLRRHTQFAGVISKHETTIMWPSRKLNCSYMFKNYFKIAWRNITRHKSYSAINVAGLAVGIAACLLIFVVVQYELSFDTYQPGYKSTYRIVTKKDREGNIRYSAGISTPAVDAFRLYFPQATIAGINAIYGSQIVAPAANGNAAGDKKFVENTGIMFAEPQLFDIFSATWLAGSALALKDPNMVVIDKSSAIKYFGNWQLAVGKTLRMDNLLTLKVAGVIQDLPPNTDLPFKVLVSYITWKKNLKSYHYAYTWDETSSDCQVYIKFPANVLQSSIESQMLSFSEKQFNSDSKRAARKRYAVAQPLSAIHFDTSFGGTLGDHVTGKSTLRTLSLIAVLIIVMASINFINLSTAQSVGRSKEVGIRKVLGSSRGQLVGLVMCETAIIVLISAGLAICIAEIALPLLKHIASVPDTIGLFNPGILLCLACVIVAVILLSGVYPAIIVSGFKPVEALKNKINSAVVGGISLRRVLVVTQFTISQLLIIGTAIAVKQMDFVNNADLGFNKEAILAIPCPADSIGLSRMNSFKQQVLTLQGVKAASFSADAPSSSHNNSSNFYFNHSDKDPGFDIFMKVADADYFKTFGLRFIAGKSYEPSDTARELVVNETFIRKLGIKRANEALGKTLTFDSYGNLPIAGVVADFKTNSMREEVKPLVMFPSKQSEQQIAVKIESRRLAKTAALVQSAWEKKYPEYAYTGFFVDDSIAKFYEQENQLELIYKVFALIAIFISCLGLYGLVSFMAVQRTREVGIRKILGASVSSIVYLFSKEFLALIVVAFMIGAPLAWYLMNGWLQTFAYRISPGLWVFVAAIISSLLIGWFTVGYKALKAALANPVKSLRTE